MIRRFYLLILMMLFSIRLLSQISTDAQFIFKMRLFLDKTNAYLRDDTQKVTKDSFLFFVFSNTVNIKMDTLLSKNIPTEYQFYALNFNYARYPNRIVHSREVTEFNEQYVSLSVGICDNYIVGINHKSGKSYRLSGFDGNDFLELLSDLNRSTIDDDYEDFISRKYFLKNCTVDGLDFKCLNKALRKKKVKQGQYSCLKRCSDPITIH